MVAVPSVSSIKLPKKALVIVEEISNKTNEQFDRDFFGLKNLLMNLKTLIVSETGILRQF
ncbi:MAG: hypothetical protein K0S31_4754 [Sphingobacterium multivorum]|jgi:hypothetical protein|nr:hypothetical protein [Sphingobacterium multivorum]